MPDVVLKNASGEAQIYEGVEAVEAPTPEGGIAVFHSEDALTADKIKVSNENVEATNMDEAITELAARINQGGGSSTEGGEVDASDVTYTPNTSSTYCGNIYGADSLTVAEALNKLPDVVASQKSMEDIEKAVFAAISGVGYDAPLTEIANVSDIVPQTDGVAVYRVTNAATFTWGDDETVYDIPAGSIWVSFGGLNDGIPMPAIELFADNLFSRTLIFQPAFKALFGGTYQKGGIPAESIVLNPPVSGHWNVRAALSYLLENGGTGDGLTDSDLMLLNTALCYAMFDLPPSGFADMFGVMFSGGDAVDLEAQIMISQIFDMMVGNIVTYSTLDTFKAGYEKAIASSVGINTAIRCALPMFFSIDSGPAPARTLSNGTVSTSISTKAGNVLNVTGLVSGDTYYVQKTSDSTWVAVTATASGQIDLDNSVNAAAGLTGSNVGWEVRVYTDDQFYVAANELFINFDGLLPISLWMAYIRMEVQNATSSNVMELVMTACMINALGRYAAFRGAETQGGGIPAESIQVGNQNAADTIDDLKFQIARLENRIEETPLGSGTIGELMERFTSVSQVPQVGDRIRTTTNGISVDFVIRNGMPDDMNVIFTADEKTLFDGLTDCVWYGSYDQGFFGFFFTLTEAIATAMPDAVPEGVVAGAPVCFNAPIDYAKMTGMFGFSEVSDDNSSAPFASVLYHVHRVPMTDEDVILPEQDLVLKSDNSSSADAPFAYIANGESALLTVLKKLQAGQMYQVSWNGTEYTCVAKSIQDVAAVEPFTGYYVHLENAADTDESGESFGIIAIDGIISGQGNVQMAIVQTIAGIAAESVTVKLKIYRKAHNVTNVPAKSIAFDTTNHPELVDVLPADPTMQDVLDYLLTNKEATT